MATSAFELNHHLDFVDTLSTAQEHAEAKREFACSIVGGNEARREMLAGSAKNAGWGAVGSRSVDESRSIETEESLVIVDLVGSEDSGAVRQEVQRLASRHGVLLLVCGNEGDPMEEIWARGLGIWLYLPGVPDDADLSSLCADALRITERNAPQAIELQPAANRRLRRAR
ncbi:MAG: hypothetical protein MI757_17870 [Pirellulales bacterium]|nr:hypothetical protein [Pirellulales bacterium]